MRQYVYKRLERQGISAARQRELFAFCEGYQGRKSEAAQLLGIQRCGDKDPTARSAERREGLLADNRMIERAARQVDGGRWYVALIRNVCYGQSVRKMIAEQLPTTHYSSFTRAREDFLRRLHRMKQEREWRYLNKDD